MRNLKALAAILAALFFGAVAATLLTGCQPAKPKIKSLGTTGTTTDVAADDTSPKVEIKDEKSAEDKADEKAAEDKPVAIPQGEAPTDGNPAGVKPADEKPAAKDADGKAAAKSSGLPKGETPTDANPAGVKPADEKAAKDKPAGGDSARSNPTVKPGEWAQWGGTSLRNNTPVGEGVVTDWVPGDFDRKTGAWKPSSARNIKWVGTLGSQTYGNTVVASGKVFLGTNNSNGYLKRYPGDVDLGVLVCLNEADGKFLWQHSSEKLPTGRVHDWPLQGICCSPLVEGNRMWFVTSRGEVRCLDVEGFYDGEDDGRPESQEPARLFDLLRTEDPAQDKVGGYVNELDAGKVPSDLRPRFAAVEMALPAGDIAVKPKEDVKINGV